jgi:hypothetical protein
MRAVLGIQPGWQTVMINLAGPRISLARSDMKKKYFMLIGAVMLCGCNQQTKLNTAKIEALSQQLAGFEQSQLRQMASIQAQLTALTPALDKINNSYFEKSHEDAFFFHTNTLYLLLTVDRKIEAQLQVAETERQAESSLAFYYHTNQTDTMYFCVAQIENAMESQETRMLDKLNTQTRLTGNETMGQIRLLAPDETEIARRKAMESDLAQIKSELEQIMMHLKLTNAPEAQP